MVKIADDLARATDLIRTFAGDDWDHTIDSADRDALVWLLEVAGGQHAYIRSRAFRDVVTAAYQMGRQAGLAECAVGVAGVMIDRPRVQGASCAREEVPVISCAQNFNRGNCV